MSGVRDGIRRTPSNSQLLLLLPVIECRAACYAIYYVMPVIFFAALAMDGEDDAAAIASLGAVPRAMHYGLVHVPATFSKRVFYNLAPAAALAAARDLQPTELRRMDRMLRRQRQGRTKDHTRRLS
jgi:hypothetical protein